MADLIELESGAGTIELEDGSGSIALEDTPSADTDRQSQLVPELFTGGSAGVRNSQLVPEVYTGGSAGIRTSQLCVEIFVRDGIVPPPAPGTSQALRRLRDFLFPSSPENFIVSIPEVEVLVQPGVGIDDPEAQGYDPQLFFSVSKDGGKTFSAEQWASMGLHGEYAHRVRFWRTPNQYRNAVGRVVVSDPVDVALVAVVVPEIKEGSS